MHSAIYCGQLKHRRQQPVMHGFRYGLFMLYLDLAELDSVFAGRWFWSTRRRALARFRREDHLGDPGQTLDEAVRDLVAAAGKPRPCGPIRLLTHLSYYGYCFNPVSFYYCFDANDRELESIVAEVNNTPWGERHCYVLHGRDASGGYCYTPDKAMHVSPFMPMDIDYDWRFRQPGGKLAVFMANNVDGQRVFDASLDLERREISGPALAKMLVAYPLMTFKVIAAIHWQALKLWLKGCPVHDHPEHSPHLLEKLQ